MQVDAQLISELQVRYAGLVDLDASLFIQLAIFLVAVVTLNALVFKPMLSVLDARQAKIGGTIDEARKTERESEQRIARYEEQIVEARRTGTDKQREMRDRAERRASELHAEARERADERLGEAMPQLQRSYESSRATLKARAEELASAIADKVIETPRG